MLKIGQLCEIRNTDTMFDGRLCRIESFVGDEVFISMIDWRETLGFVYKKALVPKVEAGPGMDLEAPCSI